MDKENINLSNNYSKSELKYINNKSNVLYKYLFVIIILLIIINYLLFYKMLQSWKFENADIIKRILEISNKKLINNIQNLKNENNINLEKKNFDNDISNKIKLLKIMTNNNVLKYKGLENCLLKDPDNEYCIYHLISPKHVIGKKRILIGEKKDGCYVLLDDFVNIKYAYSFGISKMIQFDKGLADRGIDVYMYDHTINSLPYNNSRFHWKKIGIAGKNTKNEKLKDLEELILENGHSLEKNMILKIDVEHWEWNALETVSDNTLNQFKYIVIEFHFTRVEYEAQLYYNVLNKIHKNHQAFYLRCHGRNRIVVFGNNRICKALEVSYINKNGYQFSKDESVYPIFEFDFLSPQINGKEEFNLNILKLFDS